MGSSGCKDDDCQTDRASDRSLPLICCSVIRTGLERLLLLVGKRSTDKFYRARLKGGG